MQTFIFILFLITHTAIFSMEKEKNILNATLAFETALINLKLAEENQKPATILHAQTEMDNARTTLQAIDPNNISIIDKDVFREIKHTDGSVTSICLTKKADTSFHSGCFFCM